MTTYDNPIAARNAEMQLIIREGAMRSALDVVGKYLAMAAI